MDKSNEREQIVIRSWPKVVFLYPVMLTCFFCGIWQSFLGDPADAVPDEQSAIHNTMQVAGMTFFAVLCLNLLVISFEFNRFRTMAIVFFLLAVVFFLLYLSRDWPVIEFIRRALAGLRFELSTSFYLSLGVYFVIVFAFVFLNSRFNYWVVKSNEILHKEGFLGDVRRFPSPNLRMSKEITDVFEFLLLGAGRIIFSPASEKQAIVLDHVLRVNAAEKAIQELLSSISVEIHRDADDEESPAMVTE
jgi:hypothetical protein